VRHPPVFVLDPGFHPDQVGELPLFLDLDDPRPAAAQFNEHYGHGGGWRPQTGFTNDGDTPRLQFPGDPPFDPIACMALRDEVIFVYLHSYVAVFQSDGSFEVCRMD
jgi:hypothetical protein